jgi:hypothetical protein
MPKEPQGQKRPADVIGNAVRVMQIATGEIQDNPLEPGKEYARKGGLVGGRKRAAKLSKKQRVEIARKAVAQILTGLVLKALGPFLDPFPAFF